MGRSHDEPYTHTSNKLTDPTANFVGGLHPQPDPLSTTDPDDSQHWFVRSRIGPCFTEGPVLPCERTVRFRGGRGLTASSVVLALALHLSSRK